MIAVDSNILVYSVREDSPWHRAALACVRRLAEGETVWAIAWPCVHEFLAVVTHPRIYRPATSMREAVKQVDYWWEHLKPILAGAKAVGPLVHDARVAGICRNAGVAEIWSADRDYSRFPGILTRNPLVAPS